MFSNFIKILLLVSLLVINIVCTLNRNGINNSSADSGGDADSDIDTDIYTSDLSFDTNFDIQNDIQPDILNDIISDEEDTNIIDASPDVIIEPECGNGIIEGDEQCDEGTQDLSKLCDETNCLLVKPEDWIECTDSSGNISFIKLINSDQNHTQDEFGKFCLEQIQSFGILPQYKFYGLGVFYDENLWNCISDMLNTDKQYWIGVKQDKTDPDYSESIGAWYWIGYNGINWINLNSFNFTNQYIFGSFDNGSGENVECGRLWYRNNRWEYQDYSCDSQQSWSGICMISF